MSRPRKTSCTASYSGRYARRPRLDVALILSISLSSFFIVLKASRQFRFVTGPLTLIELFFLLLFVVEFLLRLYIVPRRGHYIFSFFGMVDMFSILPGIAAFFFPAVRYLMVIRIFRLLRLFRVFKLVRYMEESSTLLRAIRASRPKITVFLLTIFFIVIFTGLSCISSKDEMGSISRVMY